MSDLLDQSNLSADGVVHTAAGRPFHLPKIEMEDLLEEPAMRLKASLDTINGLHDTTKTVMADDHLSSLGKEQKLKSHREKALDLIATHVEGIEVFSEHLDKREETLLAVPQNAAEAIIDRELRDWWRDQPNKARLAIIDQMSVGPEHKRLELALLRSPYAQADHELRMVRESWNRGRRLDNPAEAESISVGRRQVEWARRGMAHIAAITSLTLGQPRESVLRGLLKAGKGSKALNAFGFTAVEVERAKRILKAEADLAKAS